MGDADAEDHRDLTDDPREASAGADESRMEKVGRVLKKVSDKVGCKANLVLDNFEKQR